MRNNNVKLSNSVFTSNGDCDMFVVMTRGRRHTAVVEKERQTSGGGWSV